MHKKKSMLIYLFSLIVFAAFAGIANAYTVPTDTTAPGYAFWDWAYNKIYSGWLAILIGLGLFGTAVFFAIKGPKAMALVMLVILGVQANLMTVLTSFGMLF